MLKKKNNQRIFRTLGRPLFLGWIVLYNYVKFESNEESQPRIKETTNSGDNILFQLISLPPLFSSS